CPVQPLWLTRTRWAIPASRAACLRYSKVSAEPAALQVFPEVQTKTCFSYWPIATIGRGIRDATGHATGGLPCPALHHAYISQMPTPEEFFALEMRVGTVVAAEPFPEARKPSIKLQIDFGAELGIRHSSAQLTLRYTPEQLVGRQ